MKRLPALVAPCLVLLSASLHAQASAPALPGCWRAVKIVQHYKDGSKIEDTSARCTLRFDEERLESACVTPSGTVASTYRYVVVRPNTYEATMTGSTYRTSLIGSTRTYEYRVEGNRLSTAASLPTAEGAAATVPVRVETHAERTACE